MKVLIIHCYYQLKGGEDTVVEEEQKLLISEGHQVELLLFSNSGSNLIKLFQLPFNISSYRETRKRIKSFEPDIVHLHNLHFAASPSVLYAIKKSKIPFVQTLHNYRFLCPSGTLFFDGKPFLYSLDQPFPWTAIKKGVYKNSKIITFWLSFSMWVHRLIGTWNLSAKYIVLSENFKQMLIRSNLKLGKDKIVVKPNFCATPEPVISPIGNHFLFVGRLTVEKGISLLLQTFGKAGYELRIVGDGPLKEEVEDYGKRFSNIKYLGSLDKKGVFKELQACSSLIFPSIWFEGMPLIIIEAFSCGTPVIASKIGAMESMIVDGHNGFHFQPGNQKDLAAVVKKWVDLGEDEKDVMRKNSITTYQANYSPDSNATQLIGIYRSVLQESKAV